MLRIYWYNRAPLFIVIDPTQNVMVMNTNIYKQYIRKQKGQYKSKDWRFLTNTVVHMCLYKVFLWKSMRNVKTYRFEKDILTYLSSNVMYGPLCLRTWVCGLKPLLIGWRKDGRGRARVTFQFGPKWEGYKLPHRLPWTFEVKSVNNTAHHQKHRLDRRETEHRITPRERFRPAH